MSLAGFDRVDVEAFDSANRHEFRIPLLLQMLLQAFDALKI